MMMRVLMVLVARRPAVVRRWPVLRQCHYARPSTPYSPPCLLSTRFLRNRRATHTAAPPFEAAEQPSSSTSSPSSLREAASAKGAVGGVAEAFHEPPLVCSTAQEQSRQRRVLSKDRCEDASGGGLRKESSDAQLGVGGLVGTVEAAAKQQCPAALNTAFKALTDAAALAPPNAHTRALQARADLLYCDFFAKAASPEHIRHVIGQRQGAERQHLGRLHECLLQALACVGKRAEARHIAAATFSVPGAQGRKRHQQKQRHHQSNDSSSTGSRMTSKGYNSLVFMAARFGKSPMRWLQAMEKAQVRPNLDTSIAMLCRFIAFGQAEELRTRLPAAVAGLQPDGAVVGAAALPADELLSADQLLPLLHCCYDMRDAQQAHVVERILSQDLGLPHTFLSAQAVLRVYGECGHAPHAEELVTRLRGQPLWRETLSVSQKQALHEARLRARCMQGEPDKAEQELVSLLADGIPVTQRMLRFIAAGYTACRDVAGVKSVFRRVVHSMEHTGVEDETVDQMLSSFAVLQQPDDCETILHTLATAGFEPSHTSYGFLLEAYARRHGPAAAEERLLRLKAQRRLEPQLPEYLALMIGYVQVRDPEGCQEVFDAAVRAGLRLDHRFLCTLAKAYALVGDYLQVEHILYKTMPQHGVRMRPAAFLHLVNAYSNGSQHARIVDLLLNPSVKHTRRTFQRAVSLLARALETKHLCRVVERMARDMTLDRQVVNMCVRLLCNTAHAPQQSMTARDASTGRAGSSGEGMTVAREAGEGAERQRLLDCLLRANAPFSSAHMRLLRQAPGLSVP